MSHDSDDHPACRNCCRAAGDTSTPCRKAALLALASGAVGDPPSSPAPEDGNRPDTTARRGSDRRGTAAAPLP